MDTYSEVQRALEFAIEEHDKAGCRYGRHPYKVHLIAVLSVAIEFGINDWFILQAIVLHDILEDTNVAPAKLEELFGHGVTSLVEAVTNEEYDDQNNELTTRKEKFVYTYKKINQTEDAIYVKLCDRIANVRSCISVLEDISSNKRNKSLYGMYKKEYGAFRKALYRATNRPILAALWTELDKLMLWEP
jgi:(p)ppGpp synthase/HD superfamily hydrolase